MSNKRTPLPSSRALRAKGRIQREERLLNTQLQNGDSSQTSRSTVAPDVPDTGHRDSSLELKASQFLTEYKSRQATYNRQRTLPSKKNTPASPHPQKVTLGAPLLPKKRSRRQNTSAKTNRPLQKSNSTTKKTLAVVQPVETRVTKTTNLQRALTRFEILSQVRVTENELDEIRPGAPRRKAFIKSDPNRERCDTLYKSIRLNRPEIKSLDGIRKGWKGVVKSRNVHKDLSEELLKMADEKHEKLVSKQTREQ